MTVSFFRILLCLMLPVVADGAVDYPGQPPGKASLRNDGQETVMENSVMSARFTASESSLKLRRVERSEGGLFQGTDDLFRIELADGTSLGSSEMRLASAPRTEILRPATDSAQASSRIPGVALRAVFHDPDNTLEVSWQASLRDDAGYLREAIAVVSLKGEHPITAITGLSGSLDGCTVSGYTDGAVFTGGGFFAGLETPMAKLSLDSDTSHPIGRWTPALVAPKRMTFRATFATAGDWKIQCDYTSGHHRLDVGGVELLNAKGTVLARDGHPGYAGTPSSNNTYILKIPTPGSYTVGIDCPYPNDDTNSFGTIMASAVNAPATTTRTLRATWPRNLTLSPGAVWKTAAVIGVHPPGQLRRSFLHYLERERAHPFRQFVHYNSWYDLNIGRNDKTDPLQRMSEAQTLAVVDAWNREFFTARGVHLDAFVWDDGWDSFNSLWGFHAGFPRGFTETNRRAAKQQAGTGAWLSPWGGYGASKDQRVAFWNSKHEPHVSQFHLSDAEYYQAFSNRCLQMLKDYDMRYFKFDGIGAGTFATGPAPGNEGDIDGLLRLLGELRVQRRDVFINCTVGTWASPFWLLSCDSIWRQGEDASLIGAGNNRERWITYRDNMVHDRFAANAPLFPLNSLMFHGLLVGNYPGTVPAGMPLDLKSVTNEVRCATACGSGLQELYVTPGLMTPPMWDELAKSIRWLRANADVMADVHWLGGDPEQAGAQAPYGWAAWNHRKGTLALRNPTAGTQRMTLTLAGALELPEQASTAFTVAAGYEDQRPLPGITGSMLNGTTPITFDLQPFEVLVFDLWPKGSPVPKAALSASR